MGSPLDSSQFRRLLDTRLRMVGEGRYKDVPSKRGELFNMTSSESAWEEFYEIGSLPDIPEFNGKLSYLAIAPGFHTRVEHKEYAAGIQAERKLIDDKKYTVLDNRAGKLMESAARTQEKIAVGPFNDAFATFHTFMEREEATALCSNSHQTKSAVSTTTGFDNLATTALSKAQLATVRLAFRQFRNDIGEHIDLGDEFVILIPEALEDTLNEILWTRAGYQTTEHTVNVAARRNYTPLSWIRLDDNDTNNWFMINRAQMKQDLMWFNRINAELKNTVDFETYAYKNAVYFRCSWGWKDWRWIYGSNVA